MNVLEIYPNFAWWFDAAKADGIEALRATVRISDPRAQAEGLEKLRPKQAYYLLGDAAAFDLVPEVFDEIVLHYEPTPLKRLILERRIGQWIGSKGAVRYEPTVIQLHDPNATFESLPAKLAKIRGW